MSRGSAPTRPAYAPPSAPLRGPPGEAQLTMMLNCWDVCCPPLSETRAVKVYVPAEVGVPWMMLPRNERTGGNWPAVIAHVYGWVPPSANRPMAYDEPTAPGASVEL